MSSDLENLALYRRHQGVLPLSCLPASYQYNPFTKVDGGCQPCTHFWIEIPDASFVFELIKLDAQNPPEDLWGLALLKVAILKNGKVQSIKEMLEFVFELPFQPEMVELVDLWLVRLKTAVKEAKENEC